jgi:hypothetical protein
MKNTCCPGSIPWVECCERARTYKKGFTAGRSLRTRGRNQISLEAQAERLDPPLWVRPATPSVTQVETAGLNAGRADMVKNITARKFEINPGRTENF